MVPVRALVVGDSESYDHSTRSFGTPYLTPCPLWADELALRMGASLVMMGLHDSRWTGRELRGVSGAVRAAYTDVLGCGAPWVDCIGCALTQKTSRDRTCSGVLELCAELHGSVCGVCRATVCVKRMHRALLDGPRIPIGPAGPPVKVVATIETHNDGNMSEDEEEFEADWAEGTTDDLVRTLRTDAAGARELLLAYVASGDWPGRTGPGDRPLRWIRLTTRWPENLPELAGRWSALLSPARMLHDELGRPRVPVHGADDAARVLRSVSSVSTFVQVELDGGDTLVVTC